MEPISGARVLSGTVLELAEFAHENGYILQSNRRGYITFIPINKSNYKNSNENVIQFHRNQ